MVSSSLKRIGVVFLCSLFCELFQFVFSTGITDINDLILNTAGGVLGIGIYSILRKLIKEDRANKLIIGLGGVVGVLLTAIFTITSIVN